MPPDFRQLDHDSLFDGILHLRHTARWGGSLLRGKASELLEGVVSANAAGLALLLSLKHELPSEWHKFIVANAESPMTLAIPPTSKIKRDRFPLFTQRRKINGVFVQVHIIQG